MDQKNNKAKISLVAPKHTAINSGDIPPLVPKVNDTKQRKRANSRMNSKEHIITADLHNPSSYAEALLKRGSKEKTTVPAEQKAAAKTPDEPEPWLPS